MPEAGPKDPISGFRHPVGVHYVDTESLQAGLAEIRRAPRDAGTVELIVRRPAPEERQVVAEAELDPAAGLVGDNWLERGSRATEDGSAHPEMQLTMMSARAAALIARAPERWALAGQGYCHRLSAPHASQIFHAGSAVFRLTTQYPASYPG